METIPPVQVVADESEHRFLKRIATNSTFMNDLTTVIENVVVNPNDFEFDLQDEDSQGLPMEFANLQPQPVTHHFFETVHLNADGRFWKRIATNSTSNVLLETEVANLIVDPLPMEVELAKLIEQIEQQPVEMISRLIPREEIQQDEIQALEVEPVVEVLPVEQQKLILDPFDEQWSKFMERISRNSQCHRSLETVILQTE